MNTNKTSSRYMGMFDRGYGRECIEIKLDYPFCKSGVFTPATMLVYVSGIGSNPGNHEEVVCILVHSQEEFARHIGTSQQDVSDCMARHRDIQKRLGRT